MGNSKKNRSKSEKIYSPLVGKTKEEVQLFLHSKGFKKNENENEIYIKKTNLLSTTKLEIYYEKNVALMITVYESFFKYFSKESVLI